MKNKRSVLLTALVFHALISVSASAQGGPRITLEQAIDMALRHNHTLRAARTTESISRSTAGSPALYRPATASLLRSAASVY